tara:strand:+ start:1001 stop:1570 length:570 start_codon:yes stop_codon:yes gene_type:complete
MPKKSPKKNYPIEVCRDLKTKKTVRKKQYKTITYDWDGGRTTRKLTFPNVDLNDIGPANSEGIFNENFSGLNFENSNLSYSHFINCNFKKTNMKSVKMNNSVFRGSDFRGAYGLNAKHIRIIKSTGGILNEEDDKRFKSQQRKIKSLAANYNKHKAKCAAIKKEIYVITESNPVHGDSVEVTNKYKIFG